MDGGLQWLSQLAYTSYCRYRRYLPHLWCTVAHSVPVYLGGGGTLSTYIAGLLCLDGLRLPLWSEITRIFTYSHNRQSGANVDSSKKHQSHFFDCVFKFTPAN